MGFLIKHNQWEEVVEVVTGINRHSRNRADRAYSAYISVFNQVCTHALPNIRILKRIKELGQGLLQGIAWALCQRLLPATDQLHRELLSTSDSVLSRGLLPSMLGKLEKDFHWIM